MKPRWRLDPFLGLILALAIVSKVTAIEVEDEDQDEGRGGLRGQQRGGKSKFESGPPREWLALKSRTF